MAASTVLIVGMQGLGIEIGDCPINELQTSHLFFPNS
jgi:hypothetical protein